MLDTQGQRCAVGAGWRPGLAGQIASSAQVDFLEVMYEDLAGAVPASLRSELDAGVQVVVHGATLSLGSADGVDHVLVDRMAAAVGKVGAPLASEHVAFVRSAQFDSGHLLPVPHTGDMVEVLVENIATARSRLPVPLALENISVQFQWPDATYDEASFLREVVRRTGTQLLLDVSNLYGNAMNCGFEVGDYLDRLPLDRLAYLHIGGGVIREGAYHDTHAHTIMPGALDVLAAVCERLPRVAVLVERDDDFPDPHGFDAELATVRAVCEASLR